MPIRSYSHPGRAPQPHKKKAGRPKTATTALIPAAARSTTHSLPVEEQQLNGEAIETFTKAVGGRAALVDVLSVASTAPEVEQIVNHLLDHRYRTWSLRKLCTLHGISVADLFTAYRKALIAKAHVEATHIIASRLPPIVDDVMTRAAPQEIACSCEGKERKTCPLCHGTGVTLTLPDLDRQKLALELGHLTEKKAGFIVQQNQGVLSSGATLVAQGSGALEQLQQAVGELLFSPARRRASSPVSDPREPPPPVEEPRRRDVPLPRDEPRDDPDRKEDDEEDDEEEPADQPLRS